MKTSALPEGVKRLESPREIKIARDARWDIAKGKGKKRSHDEDEESEVFNSIISTEYDAEFEEFFSEVQRPQAQSSRRSCKC